MPASQAQIEANRKNAQKSTGPRTPEGKAKSSKNAMKHGLFSQDIIINSKYHTENEQDYQELLDSLFDQFEPNGHFECYLVRTIANALWRQRRVVTAETAFINTKLNNIDHHLETESLLNKYLRKPDDLTTDPAKRQAVIDNLKGTSLVLDPKTSDTLLRIETRLERQIIRSFNLLLQLQSLREKKEKQNPAIPCPDLLERRPERSRRATLQSSEKTKTNPTPPATSPPDDLYGPITPRPDL